MQCKASVTVAQVSTARLLSCILLQVSRNREGQFNPSINGCQTTGVGVPLDPVRTSIIANRDNSTLRTLNRFEVRNGLPLLQGFSDFLRRSEERRVGKECRCGW